MKSLHGNHEQIIEVAVAVLPFSSYDFTNENLHIRLCVVSHVILKDFFKHSINLNMHDLVVNVKPVAQS